jgi:hypothetical protein
MRTWIFIAVAVGGLGWSGLPAAGQSQAPPANASRLLTVPQPAPELSLLQQLEPLSRSATSVQIPRPEVTREQRAGRLLLGLGGLLVASVMIDYAARQEDLGLDRRQATVYLAGIGLSASGGYLLKDRQRKAVAVDSPAGGW